MRFENIDGKQHNIFGFGQNFHQQSIHARVSLAMLDSSKLFESKFFNIVQQQILTANQIRNLTKTAFFMDII